jgi:hypothetical protein
MKNIVIIEPIYGENIHLPFNAGLVNVVATAFDSANLTFVGNASQTKKIADNLPVEHRTRCVFKHMRVYADKDTNPLNVVIRLGELLWAAGREIFNADLIVLCSASGTTLAAVQLLMRPKKQSLQVFLHGNLNDLNGWRSRNPFRRFFDFSSTLKRASASQGQFLVLEEHILARAAADFPWMKKNVRYFPHPQIDEESIVHKKSLQFPIKIGLIGIASPDKGFVEFCTLAKILKRRFPSKFEFHAIGKKHKSNLNSDFEMLDRPPSEKQLERETYLREIDKMHFLFFWPVGEYYRNASSGIFYDGINRKIPFLTNSSAKSFCRDIEAMAIVADGLDELETKLLEIDTHTYAHFVEELEKFRLTFAVEGLATRFKALISEFSPRLSEDRALDQEFSTGVPVSPDK